MRIPLCGQKHFAKRLLCIIFFKEKDGAYKMLFFSHCLVSHRHQIEI